MITGNVLIGAVDKDTLKGKKVLYYYESGEADLLTIKSSRMADPKFAIRDLFITLGDGVETIPQDKISDFKAGKLVSLKSGKRYYGMKLKSK